MSGEVGRSLVTVVIVMMTSCPVTQQLTIDQQIAGAAESADVLEFMSSEDADTVKLELDMVFRKSEYAEMVALNNSDLGEGKRNALKNTKYRWTNNVVPYEISPGVFSFSEQQQLEAAMKEWSVYSCVTFRHATPHDVNKIKFVDGGGCSSFVGMVGNTQQVTLAKTCRTKGIIVHELGHALGFHHEQTRPDRDDHVTILYQNIPDDREHNFQKYSSSVIEDLDVPYDYNSVMHYGPTAFSSNGQLTIKTRDPSYQYIIGNRAMVSFRDIKLANRMMGCKPASCTLTDDQCPGEGFVNRLCQCACPGNSPTNPVVICQAGSSHLVQPGTSGTTGGTAGCTDVNPSCPLLAPSICSTNPSFASMYCRATCRLCQSQTGSTSTCADLAPACPNMAAAGYCQLPAYLAYVQTNCRLSCHLCVG